MSISLRKALPLSLLLLVCLCLFLLPTAYADGLEDLVNAVESHDESFTITENTTIPEGMHLQAWDTELTVQQGKTLTVQGNMNASVLNIDGTVTLDNWGFIYSRRITLGSAGRLNITGNNFMKTSYEDSQDLIGDSRIHFGEAENNALVLEINVCSSEEFNSALDLLKAIESEHYFGVIRVVETFSLESGTIDLNSIPVGLEVADGKTLTVPAGTTLEANRINVSESTLEVNGSLSGNAEIRLERGGRLRFADDGCFVTNQTAYILLSPPANPDTQIAGLNMSRFTRINRGNEILFLDNAGLFDRLKEACEKGEEYFDLRNRGLIEIPESITIPAGMTVDATGTEFVVTVGNRVTVNGKLILTAWNLFGTAISSFGMCSATSPRQNTTSM